MSDEVDRAGRQRLADVMRHEVTLGLTGWLTGSQFSVGWIGHALDTPELLSAAQEVLPSVAKIATLDPTVGVAIGVLGQLLADSTMSATAEQMTEALSPFRDLVDLIGVRREGMQVFMVAAVFADNLDPHGLETRVAGCHQYSAALTRAMLAHGLASALNMGAVMEVVVIFFDSDRFDEVSELPLDLFEERQGRLVYGTLVDWTTGRIQLPAPDTFSGRLREGPGMDEPIFGAVEFDIADLHIQAWRARIARNASSGSAALRLVEPATGTVTDLPQLAQLKRAITETPPESEIAVYRLDRSAEMVIRRVGPMWELARAEAELDGWWISGGNSMTQAISAITAYRRGDLALGMLDWQFAPND